MTGHRLRWLWLGGSALAIVVLAVILVVAGRSAPRSAASLRYGQIPAWLPKPTPPDQVAAASVSHPVLAAVEGNTVDARLADGSVSVTAVGPAIPAWVSATVQSGSWDDDHAAPATFTVTLSGSKGVVPLRAGAFSILTGQGQIIHPAVTGAHGSPLPPRLLPGRPITLTIKVDLTEGDGALRWAPQGSKVLVAWFYHLELD